MKTYTINADDAIAVFPTAEAAAATTTPFDTPFEAFASLKELSALAAKWPAERLVAIWNSLPGVEPVKSFKSAKIAAGRIWERIQGLGETKGEPKKAAKSARVGAQAGTGSPSKGKAAKKATPAKGAPKAKKGGKPEASGPREGSKTAQVVAMLQRKNGVTLEEIMSTMNWQRHTVRGFMAGAMKKAGYQILSTKPEGGERTYQIKA